MNSETNIDMIRLFSFSYICLFLLCTSCTKDRQELENHIEIIRTRYQILVNNTKAKLTRPIVFGRPDITHAYQAYRYDKQELIYIPSIVDFDKIFVDGDAYYLLAIREERTLNVEDGGSTYYLENIISRYPVLCPVPFE